MATNCYTFHFRLHTSSPSHAPRVISKKMVDLKAMIHLGINLRPTYTDPSVRFLSDLPMDTFIIELHDGKGGIVIVKVGSL